MSTLDNEISGSTSSLTGLDVLLDFANRDAATTVMLEHSALPGLRFLALVPRDGSEYAKVVKAAAKRLKCQPEDVPNAVINRWQIAAAVQEIQSLVDGQWSPVSVDGDIVSFASPELKARLGADSAADAVWRLIKDDGVINALVRELTSASNFGSDASAVDPTTAR